MYQCVADAIMQRRSIRSFTGKPLDSQHVMDLLKAAQLAPSSLNSQPWRFKVVTNRQDLDWLAGEPSRHQGWLATAGAVFVCCVDVRAYILDSEAALAGYENSGMPKPMVDGIRAYVEAEKAASGRELELSAALNLGLAVENMMLHGVELGLGTCWVGMFDRLALAERFGLAAQIRPICLLAVGEPAVTLGGASDAQSRKPLDDLIIP